MNIFTVVCAEGCPPMHYTALHRAEAGMAAHYIARGHECAMKPSRVEVSP